MIFPSASKDFKVLSRALQKCSWVAISVVFVSSDCTLASKILAHAVPIHAQERTIMKKNRNEYDMYVLLYHNTTIINAELDLPADLSHPCHYCFTPVEL